MPARDDVVLQAHLRAVAAGDRDAFRALYVASSPKLFATIYRILRDRAAAEEVLQDVYLRIWQNAARYSPTVAPALVWMNSIARNRSIDVVRQNGHAKTVSVSDDVDWFERVAEDRDRERDMIDNAALRHCLQALETQARTCVLLAYYEGSSREELATRFDRPVNTIKTWLHRALASLRECLDGTSP